MANDSAQPMKQAPSKSVTLLEQNDDIAAAVNQLPEGMKTTPHQTMEQPWTPDLVKDIGFGIGFFGVVLVGVMTFLVMKDKIRPPEGDGQWLVRLFVVPVCVLAAVFLVVAGYSNDQQGPAMGLIGTVVGYLLGAGTRTVSPAPAPPAQG